MRDSAFQNPSTINHQPSTKLKRQCRITFSPVIELSDRMFRLRIREALGHLTDTANKLGIKVEVRSLGIKVEVIEVPRSQVGEVHLTP
jgi:hypothetical protein